MATVFFSSAIDGLCPAMVRRRYDRVEAQLKRRKHSLINRPGRDDESNNQCRDTDPKTWAALIVNRDIGLLKKAEVLLADFSDAHRKYVGCICEIVYAASFGIPVIAFLGRTRHFLKRPFFVHHCTVIATNWNDALDAIDQVNAAKE